MTFAKFGYFHGTQSNGYDYFTRKIIDIMMTSSNGNSLRVTGHLCGEFTGLRWIPSTKASDGGFDVFFDLRPDKQLSKQS